MTFFPYSVKDIKFEKTHLSDIELLDNISSCINNAHRENKIFYHYVDNRLLWCNIFENEECIRHSEINMNDILLNTNFATYDSIHDKLTHYINNNTVNGQYVKIRHNYIKKNISLPDKIESILRSNKIESLVLLYYNKKFKRSKKEFNALPADKFESFDNCSNINARYEINRDIFKKNDGNISDEENINEINMNNYTKYNEEQIQTSMLGTISLIQIIGGFPAKQPMSKTGIAIRNELDSIKSMILNLEFMLVTNLEQTLNMIIYSFKLSIDGDKKNIQNSNIINKTEKNIIKMKNHIC